MDQGGATAVGKVLGRQQPAAFQAGLDAVQGLGSYEAAGVTVRDGTFVDGHPALFVHMDFRDPAHPALTTTGPRRAKVGPSKALLPEGSREMSVRAGVRRGEPGRSAGAVFRQMQRAPSVWGRGPESVRDPTGR